MHYEENKENVDLLARTELIGLLGVHVDDVRLAGNATFESQVKPKIEALYDWGTWDEMV